MKYLFNLSFIIILIISLLNCSQNNIWENANDAIIETAILVSNVTGSTAENDTSKTATFTVKLSVKPADDVTINLESDDETEGIPDIQALVFTPEDWYLEKTVTVTGQDDEFKDGNKIYNIVLSAESLDIEYNQMKTNSNDITNFDDETAGIAVTPVTGNTGEDGYTAGFDVFLTAQPTGDVTVNLYSSDPTEGTTDASSLTYNNLTWSIPQTITVTGIDDNIDDGDITYHIVFADITGDDSDYNNIELPDPVSIVNIDNDTAGFTISPITGYTTEAGGTTTFTVRLMTEPAADVTIDIISADTSEVTVTPDSLVFTGADWNADQTVTLTGVDDLEEDGNQRCEIRFTDVDSSDDAYDGMTPESLYVINQDNDSAGITISPASGNTTEAGGTASFTVVLNSEPSDNVTVYFQSDNTGEGTVSPASRVFTPADYNIAQSATLTGVDDFIDDDNATYHITFSVESVDTGYDSMTPDPLPVINEDDDTAGIIFTMDPDMFTSEDGDTFIFSARLASEPAADVTVIFSASDASEGLTGVTSLTFTNASWDQTQTVTVTGQDDDINDGDIRYFIGFSNLESTDPKYSIIRPAEIRLTNIDNDTGWTECGKPGFSGDEASYVSLYVYNDSGRLIPFVAFADAAAKKAVTVMYMIKDEWFVLGERGFNGKASGYISLCVAEENEKAVPYVAFLESADGSVVVARNSGVWEYVVSSGNDGSRRINQGTGSCVSMDIVTDSRGSIIPYAGFCESSSMSRINDVSVMYYTSGTWKYAGNANFADGDSSYLSLKAYSAGDSAVPFAAYCDKSHSSKAIVKAMYGSEWTDVGENGEASSGRASYISLGLYRETPYVAFISNDVSERASVMSYTDGEWNQVGTQPAYTGPAAYTSLFIFDNGSQPIPFIAFCDKTNDSKAAVYNYTGSWAPVGNTGFSAGASLFMSLFVSCNSDGGWIPFTGFSDNANNNAATVMTYK